MTQTWFFTNLTPLVSGRLMADGKQPSAFHVFAISTTKSLLMVAVALFLFPVMQLNQGSIVSFFIVVRDCQFF
ncbi:hypothetical protein [Fructobacillus americanaquae]|uniref:Uncharacterized protein n=1 Tax=Fructobacillus americanaquae TaxID=2940302 RepID=A0ABY5C2U3_9LACO|nr:hypothetical protein [Fructobacillus americanaquae]USS91636.1 hypothetical protein M3M36_04740 [Fructobacillus americanaquae]